MKSVYFHSLCLGHALIHNGSLLFTPVPWPPESSLLGGGRSVRYCESALITQNMVGTLCFRIIFKKSVALLFLLFFFNLSVRGILSFDNRFVFLGQAKSHLKSSQVNEVSNW